jgi:hypothetical protein
MGWDMDFYVSLTINRCHLKRLCDIWNSRIPDSGFPFHRAIVSPLFARNGILSQLYQNRAHCKVILDSGGFHVQQGRMALATASQKLRTLYRENAWAHRFALPDAPITSLDSRDVVKRKLHSTRSQYRTFPKFLATALRSRLLPVVHGTTYREIHRNALAARRVGSSYLGFGGFATSGPNAGVNSFTPYNLRLLVEFATLCKEWNLGLHVFGIGGPAAISVLQFVPVDSFDSAGWIRTAAYGNVYLPYIGAVNITGGTVSRRFVTKREFVRLRKDTKHVCAFCIDQELLARSWPHRALHNYCTINQAVQTLAESDSHQTLQILRSFNPRFAKYLELVLEQQALLHRKPASRET